MWGAYCPHRNTDDTSLLAHLQRTEVEKLCRLSYLV